MTSNVAALDCGTNSTRLLITDATGRTVERLMTITRLGQGVDESGQLAREAIERVLLALRHYRAVMDAYGVERAQMACTSAVRDCSNGEDFLRAAREVLNCPVDVLTGEREAQLSFAGAISDLEASGRPRLVVDIGGGSTELVLEVGGGLEAVSLQLGCVRLTERCLHGDPPTAEELDHAREVISEQFSRIDEALPSLTTVGDVEVVGLAGTVASLVLLEGQLATYDRDQVHHQILSRGVVEKWIRTLAHESNALRRLHVGMEPGRADVLLGGLLVLLAVMEKVGAHDLVTSESDILDGLAQTLR
jgi:exopolyphosphatase/guanosine-5'-triphosphate,3'-diphosphate pyrophosphatase